MTNLQQTISAKARNPVVRAAFEADRSLIGHRDNVGEVERLVSGLTGAVLVVEGLKKRSIGGLAMAALGGGLVARGLTGHCSLYQQLGISTADRRRVGYKGIRHIHHGILVKKSVTVNRPIEDVYGFWRNFENFPKFMKHVESVTTTGPGRSHWVVRGPLGMSLEWDAEIFNERPNELIAWRTLEGSEIDHAGSVRFRPAPGNRGTEVHVELNYQPPAGRVGVSIARLLGEEPEVQLEDDLSRFKQVMEAGEIATIEGQPHGW